MIPEPDDLVDLPGAYALLTMVGPTALGKLMNPTGGPIADAAETVRARVIDAADVAELRDMILAAVDLLARGAVDDLKHYAD